MVEKRVKKFGQGPPPPFLGNARKKSIFLMGGVPSPWSSDTGSHGWGPFEFPHSTTSVDVWIYPATLLLSLANVVSIN